jgi:hypothetical protein
MGWRHGLPDKPGSHSLAPGGAWLARRTGGASRWSRCRRGYEWRPSHLDRSHVRRCGWWRRARPGFLDYLARGGGQSGRSARDASPRSRTGNGSVEALPHGSGAHRISLLSLSSPRPCPTAGALYVGPAPAWRLTFTARGRAPQLRQRSRRTSSCSRAARADRRRSGPAGPPRAGRRGRPHCCIIVTEPRRCPVHCMHTPA